MSSVEERLSKVERDIEEIKKRQSKNGLNWLLPANDKFKDDEELKEIFRLGKELRDQERIEETA